MAEPKGLLAVWMDVPPQNEEEFNDWYNTDHVPERLAIPGFQSARRYVVQEGSPPEERGADPSLLAKEGRPKYLALYALDSVDVLQTEVYKMALANPTPWTQRVRHYHTTVRNVYRQIFPDAGAPDDGQAANPPEFLLAVQMDVDPEQEAEFNDWYNQEHCPMLLSVPGMLGARRFEAVEGEPKYAAFYEIESPEVPESAGWVRARETPWRKGVEPYTRNRKRDMYRLILSQEAPR